MSCDRNSDKDVVVIVDAAKTPIKYCRCKCKLMANFTNDKQEGNHIKRSFLQTRKYGLPEYTNQKSCSFVHFYNEAFDTCTNVETNDSILNHIFEFSP